jgi:PAS domain S-box-containing protein
MSETNKYTPPVDQQRYEYILEGSGLGSWDWWLDSNKVHFDERWCSMLGLDSASIVQELSTWDERVHPEDKAKAYEDIKNYLDGKTTVYENTHRMKHADGHWVWILDRGKISEWDTHKKPIRFTGTHLDVSKFMENESLSKEIQKIANIGGWEMDLETDKTKWTEQTYHIHKLPNGTPTEKIMGINFYAPHDQDKITQLIKDCIKGSPYRSALEFIDANHNHRWVEVTGEPIYNANGEVIKLRGTIQDITERRFFDKSFHDQKIQLDRLMKNSPGMVYQFKMSPDGQMYFNYVSDKAYDIYEIPPAEFKKNPAIMVEMVQAELQEGLKAAIQKSAQELTPFEWEGKITTPQGKTKWILARSIPQPEPDQSTLWDGIVVEITKRKQLEELLDLERSKSMLNAKLASLGEMAAGIAHEINNPLAIIVGNLGLLSYSKSDESKIASRIEDISKAASRISKIVKGLKSFSRTSPGSELKNENIFSLITESLIMTTGKSKRHGVEITTDISPDLIILCDAVEIEQVMINLINNAIDATKSKEERWIKINAYNENDQTVVQVIDSGQGITPKVQEKLFQPFFTTKPTGEGTGLGLSIAKGILDNHQAELKLNTQSKNTCFEIRFPKITQKLK